MSDAGILLKLAGNSAYAGLSIKSSAAFVGNVGPISIVGVAPAKPARLYRVEVSIVLTVLATTALNAQFNIIATDAAGAFTAPVPLVASLAGVPTASVNMAVATRAAGQLVFESNGAATDVSISITGITVPGPLAGIWSAIFTPIG